MYIAPWASSKNMQKYPQLEKRIGLVEVVLSIVVKH
jgi:hypothetical protein